jgi:hypothetical protein
MNTIEAVSKIKLKFTESCERVNIPLLKDGYFTARMTEEGIMVDNLGCLSLLPWAVFQEAICVLIRNGGRAKRGDAMTCKLGENGLSVDSIEGHIALVVYGKQTGDTVFRRITPIACILIWAGICSDGPRELVLL